MRLPGVCERLHQVRSHSYVNLRWRRSIRDIDSAEPERAGELGLRGAHRTATSTVVDTRGDSVKAVVTPDASQVRDADTPTTNLERRRQQAQSIGDETYTNRRELILRAAAEVMRAKGLQATSLKDIAEACGGDRASIYYYFRNKDEMFREMIREGIDDLVHGLEAVEGSSDTADERLAAAFQVVLRAYAKHYPYLYVYFQGNHGAPVVDAPLNAEIRELGHRFERLFRDIAESGHQDGSFKFRIPISVVVNSILGMVNWTHQWYRPDGIMSADEIAAAMASMVVEGLRANSPKPRRRRTAAS